MDTLCYWFIGVIVALIVAAVIANNYQKKRYDALVASAKQRVVDALAHKSPKAK